MPQWPPTSNDTYNVQRLVVEWQALVPFCGPPSFQSLQAVSEVRLMCTNWSDLTYELVDTCSSWIMHEVRAGQRHHEFATCIFRQSTDLQPPPHIHIASLITSYLWFSEPLCSIPPSSVWQVDSTLLLHCDVVLMREETCVYCWIYLTRTCTRGMRGTNYVNSITIITFDIN